MKPRLALAALALVPAAAALLWVSRAAPFPEPADWRRLWGDGPLCFAWPGSLDFAGEPNFVASRALGLLLLGLPGMDFGRTALVCWLLALAACCLVARLARGEGGGVAWPALSWLALGLLAFSPGHGADWLLGERLRVFLAPCCFLLALVILRGDGAWRRRFWLALAFVLLALVSDRSGVVGWIAALPLVGVAAARGGARPGSAIAIWCVAGNLAAALCYDDPAALGMSRVGLVGDVAAGSAEPLGFFARALAWGLPDAWPASGLDELLVGVALLLALVWFAVDLVRRRAEPGLVARATPWLACALWGLGLAVWLAEQYWPAPLADAFLREMAWSAWLLPMGGLGLAIVLHPRAARAAGLLLVPLVVVFAGLDWPRGWAKLELEQRLLRQRAALMVFADALPTALPPAPPLPIPRRRDVVSLRARGRLRAVVPVTSPRLDELTAATGSAGTFEGVARRTARGTLSARGTMDLVLLTRLENGVETIVQVAAPDWLLGADPTPWSVDLGEALSGGGTEGLRAWGFDFAARRVVALGGAGR